ncbi:hypothetical protein G4Z16_18925 [Streptomyces bathyalis]|uniref:Integrin n=1 Tax=Streptomyces bathyalis TaxID=2710756 RepID=A0A7T1T830_9ACTN|nr:FG-GAP-like repeat-containing protein [Streptomyces bathyalis]QPP08130.1 hypothetical protein G4Z16_18925 [Streptomyces bathyalis]
MTPLRRPDARNARGGRAARAAVPLAAALLAAGGLSAWTLTPEEAHAAPAEAAAPADDLNGDGFADLVSSAPGGTISGKAQAGYVAVTYGSAEGLDPSRKKLVSRSTSGVPGSASAKQQFGKTVARGDLDGDGYGDLVIGSDDAPSGSVILWGSPSGPTGGTALGGYGHTPQVGDFDGDGKADLALFGDAEVEGDDPVAHPGALFKGPISRDGSPAERQSFMDKSEWWGYGDEGPGCAEDDSCIDGPSSISGPVTAQAVGDVNGDERQDIAVWQYEGDGVWGNHVLLGGKAGFTTSGTISDIGSTGDEGDSDMGDVDGDGFDDLVLGSAVANKATVVFGSASGPSGDREQSIDQSLPGFPGAQEDGDRVGSCVSVADVTGDGRAEVALGIGGEDFGGLKDAGSVALLHGSPSGATGTGSQVVHQDTANVPGVAETGDEFGAACALSDVDGDGHRDLNASSTKENASAGADWSLRGTGDGLTTQGAAAFGPGDVGGPVTKALFGSFLR